MIQNDSEHQQALDRLSAAAARLKDHEAGLRERGLSRAEIMRALDPARSFTMQIQAEVEAYSRMLGPGAGDRSGVPGGGSRDV